MTKEGLVEQLRFQIDDLKETFKKAEAVRSFVDQGLLTEEQAVEDQFDLLQQIIRKSAEIDDLIENFLKSFPDDSYLIDAAKQILSAARAEIPRSDD